MEFFQTIKQVGVFIICAQTILHFRPSPKYEKYLKLLVSVMILVQLIIPVMKFFQKDEMDNFRQRVEEFQISMQRDMEQLQIETAINEENILKKTKAEIRSKINSIAMENELLVCSIDFEKETLEGKLTVWVKEYTGIQQIEIQVDLVSIGKEQDIKIANSQENSDKLQVLSKQIANELGKREEDIEVIWYGEG